MPNEATKSPGITYREACQWWNHPNPRLAYYLCLRWVYEMPASEALASMRNTEARYPNVINDLMGSLRRVVNPPAAVEVGPLEDVHGPLAGEPHV